MQEILECIVELFFFFCQGLREFFCFHKPKDYHDCYDEYEDYTTICIKCGKVLDMITVDKEGNVY